jgi:uncharacterized protein YggE
MATISVTGAARRLITPDRGTARVVVRFEVERRGDALAAARRLHDRLTSEARRLEADGAATEWSADQVWVSTSERSRGERKEPKRVTVATASVRVTFVDLTALGAWLADVAEREGASVYGIEWSVSEERRREVEAEVRTEAALDALHRARAYASAVGLETVELTALDEPGLREGRVQRGFVVGGGVGPHADGSSARTGLRRAARRPRGEGRGHGRLHRALTPALAADWDAVRRRGCG